MKALACASFLVALTAGEGAGGRLSVEAPHNLPFSGFVGMRAMSALQLGAKVTVPHASGSKARDEQSDPLLMPGVEVPPAGSAPVERDARPHGVVAAVAEGVARVFSKAAAPPDKSIKDHAIEAGHRHLRHQMAVPGSHQTHHSQAPHSMESFFMWSFADVAVFLIIWSILTILCAWWYDRNKVPPPLSGKTPEFLPGEIDGEWKFHLFDCCSKPDICLWAVCCPGIPWADTLRMGGFARFWVALAVFSSLWMLSSVLGVVFLWALAGVGAWYRQRLRALFKIENGTCSTVVQDFLAYCCCPWCSIVQEARTMEEAYASKHSAIAAPQARYMASLSATQRSQALATAGRWGPARLPAGGAGPP